MTRTNYTAFVEYPSNKYYRLFSLGYRMTGSVIELDQKVWVEMVQPKGEQSAQAERR